MYTRLISFLNVDNIINPSRHGFRTYHNTITAIIDLLNFVKDKKSQNTLILLLFIDISKAFDSLSHIILLNKLEFYCISGHVGLLNCWFSNYLSERYHYVQCDQHRPSTPRWFS